MMAYQWFGRVKILTTKGLRKWLVLYDRIKKKEG